MPLTRVQFENITAFESLDLTLSKGMNVFIGTNGTGKTHILKALYAASAVANPKQDKSFAEKLVAVFRPDAINRLVRRKKGGSRGTIAVYNNKKKTELEITTKTQKISEKKKSDEAWHDERLAGIYIPVKEMLTHAAGFRSLYTHREIAFSEVYYDIIDVALLPPLRGRPTGDVRIQLLEKIKTLMAGRVVLDGEAFYLQEAHHGKIEFSLLSEGMRKLGLLWLLISNGMLEEGAVLFWDEPEANLNPSRIGALIDILLTLQRSGVQIFIATHDYVVLKELDLRIQPENEVLFHSCYRERDDAPVTVESADTYTAITKNVIIDTFGNLYDRDVERALGGSSDE